MKRRRVRFTETAQQHLRDLRAWWKKNTSRPELVVDELTESISLVSVLPGVGAPYEHPRVPHLRRVHLRRLSSHVYYTFTDAEVIVYAIWHTSRRRGPPLRG